MMQKQPEDRNNNINNLASRSADNLVKMTGGHIATLIVLAISGFVIPRFLGVEKFGVYAAVIAVISIMQVVTALGLNQVTMRFLGPLWMLNKRSDAIKLGSSILTIRIALAVLAGLITTFWLYFSTKLELTFFLALLIGVVCFFRSGFNTSRIFFLSLGHPGKTAGFEVLRVTLTLPVVILFFSWFDLKGIFIGLLSLSVVLFLVCIMFLLKIIPLRLGEVKWETMRPYIRFSLLTHIGLVSVVFQNSFSIYFVASFVTQKDAAFLAIAINLFIIVLNLIRSVEASLFPIMAEMEEMDQSKRLGYWGGLIMRYSATVTGIIVIGWVLMGRYLIHMVLTNAFLPVFPIATLILISAIFVSCAGACNSILNIKNMAGIASVNRMIFGIITILGLFVVINGKFSNITVSIAWVYVIAALIFWICAYLTLGFFGKLWLPLKRTLSLILPIVFLVWTVQGWIISLWVKFFAFFIFLILYGFIAILLRLLPLTEVKEIYYTFIKQRLKSNRSA